MKVRLHKRATSSASSLHHPKMFHKKSVSPGRRPAAVEEFRSKKPRWNPRVTSLPWHHSGAQTSLYHVEAISVSEKSWNASGSHDKQTMAL